MSNEYLTKSYELNPIDPDARRRLTTNIYSSTNPLATMTNATVFSFYSDTQAKLISTSDTTVPMYRIDNGNTICTVMLYMRRNSLANVPSLASIPFFDGGNNMSGFPINDVKASIQTVASNTICNASYVGINGWKLANVEYDIGRKTTGDLLEGKRLALVGYTPSEPVIQLALVLNTTDSMAQVTSHIHVDAVEFFT